MAESRETSPAKPDAEKKPPETVLLTAEELRAIAGGAPANPGAPIPVSKDVPASGRPTHPQ